MCGGKGVSGVLGGCSFGYGLKGLGLRVVLNGIPGGVDRRQGLCAVLTELDT